MFPTTAYPEAWKNFRRMSDENKVTAELITAFPFLKNSQTDRIIRILDIGCGDGLLIQQIIQKLCCDLGSSIETLTILDPYKDWLDEARNTLKVYEKCKTIPNLDLIHGKIEDHIPNLLCQHEVILAIHLVYLLDDGVFEKLVHSLPQNTTHLYVVMDAPGSVFSEIWKVTQPIYLDRVEKAHQFIKNLGFEYSVIEDSILSMVNNPLRIEDLGIRNSLLSMLSYSNYDDLSQEDIRHIKNEIDKNSTGHQLRCKSTCYEIFRK